jgi:hypothetical protein
MTTKLFEHYPTRLEKWVLIIAKYCFYQIAAHLKNTKSFSKIKVLFLPANYHPGTAFTFGNRPCIQMPLQKAAGVIDGDCSKMLHRQH